MKTIFKKSLAVLTSLLTACLIAAPTFSASAKTQLRNGDTNADGKVDFLDLLVLSRHLNKPVLTGTNLKQADYNKDGNADFLDLVMISRIMVAERKIKEVSALINAKRASTGLNKLVIDWDLSDASMIRACELPRKFSGDVRPNNSNFSTVLTQYGIAYKECENCVAAVPATPKELFDAMMGNDKIKKMIMNEKYKKIGVGYCNYNDAYKNYWAVLLIN